MDEESKPVSQGVLAVALLAHALGGCGSEPELVVGEPSARRAISSESVPPLVCSYGVSSDGAIEPEVYRPSAMNAKLAYYPELAEAVGLSAVEDCEGARRYLASYAEYRQRNPGFDSDQPLDLSPPPSPPQPELAEPVVEQEKILNGEPTSRNPVFSLEFKTARPGNTVLGRAVCTGTFIAKNWILTAAHCVTHAAIDGCLRDGLELKQCTPEFHNWGKWSLFHKDYAIRDVMALAYVHPDWPGRDLSNNRLSRSLSAAEIEASAPRDVALLYVPDDRRLPPNVERDGAMRLSAVKLCDPARPDLCQIRRDWELTFYGWGHPHENGSPVLRKSQPNGSIAATFNWTPNGAGALKGYAAAPNDSVICGGDSGGALVRKVRVDTHSGQLEVEAIVGVASAGLGSGSDCRFLADVSALAIWADLEPNLPWVQAQLKDWYPGFSCTRRSSVGDSADQILECWGKPCTQHSQCGKTPAYCSQPASVFKHTRCPTCPNGTCDCIVGQCLRVSP